MNDKRPGHTTEALVSIEWWVRQSAYHRDVLWKQKTHSERQL